MAILGILASIDFDIAQLQQARALLAGDTEKAPKKAVGRPKKAASVTSVATKPAKKKKRNLSPEGRKRIAEAARKRWAAKKSAAAK